MDTFYSEKSQKRSLKVHHKTLYTNSLQIRLLFLIFASQLVFAAEDICNKVPQQESIGRRQLTRGYIVCPDHCVCTGLREHGLLVDCSLKQYTHVPSGIPIDVTDLDLGRNRIQELSANSFDQLSRLKILNLYSNNIRKLHVNAFAGLIHLTKLILSKNKFMSQGLVDYVFSSLGSLTDLQLIGCGLKTLNIKAFLNLTNLHSIDLTSNQFIDVPEFTYKGTFVFSKQMTLILISNRMKSVTLKKLGQSNNASIAYISLKQNQISKLCSKTDRFDSTKHFPYVAYNDYKVIPKYHKNSTRYLKKHGNQAIDIGLQSDDRDNSHPPTPSKLTQLYLNNNDIRVVSANCFTDVTSLEILVIANNKITKINSLAFNGLVNLKELDLSGNSILTYEGSAISATPSLVTCDLSNVGMENFPVTAFTQLTNLRMLLLMHNKMKSVPNFSTGNIPILSSLKTLQMSYNKIVSLNEFDSEQDAYDKNDFCNITELNLDHNLINNLARNSFKRFPFLIVLTITNNFISKINPAAFNGLNKLSYLNISFNPIGKFLDGTFAPLVSLKHLKITNAALKNKLNPRAFLNLSNLQDLYLDSNELQDIPEFTDKNNKPIFKNLTSLSMSSNSLTGSASLYGLTIIPTLRNITLSNNRLTLRRGILLKLPNLRKLTMTKCNYINIDIHGLESRSLTHLRLTESQLNIQSNTTFEEAPMLHLLQLANCKLINAVPVQLTFRNLIYLRVIDLSKIGFIPNVNTFENSPQIQRLDLSENRLQKLDRNIFQYMNKLKVLYLKDTGLVSLDYWSLPENVRNNLKKVDLSKNPYSCDCAIVWFRRWLQTTNTVLKNNEDYTCEYPTNHRGEQLLYLTDPSDLTCFKQTTGMDWIGLSVVLLLFIFCISSLLVALLFRFRWHVRYWQSVLMLKHRQYKEMSDEHVYTYDAFVMYCQEDSHWVINELHPHLETENNIRLCIHHRDWLGGRDITDNITESIENSRKCLLIVSNAFAASQWCHFELTMAQSRLFQDDRDNLVLVLLEEISECHVTPRLRLQMQRQTYIEWTDNILGQQLFWARLTRALRGPDQSVINSPLPQSAYVDVSQHDNNNDE